LRSLLLALTLLAISTPASAQRAQERPFRSSVNEAERHLLRGDVYYVEGDYYRAITEYKAFLNEALDDPRRSRVDLKMAWIYHVANKPAAAENLLRYIALERRDEPEGWWARLYGAHVAMRSDQPLLARRAYEQVVQDCEPVLAQKSQAIARPQCLELTTRARLGLAHYWAQLDDFDRAAAELGSVPKSAPQAPDARRVAEYVSTLEIPHKSAGLAGVLSIVPGFGHFYLGEWGIGIVAMIWNGAFIFATVDSFVAGRIGQGTLLGLLELVWYGGTIFGAVSGAHRFNRDAYLIVREGLTKDIDQIAADTPWPARFPVEYPTPLKLQFEF